MGALNLRLALSKPGQMKAMPHHIDEQRDGADRKAHGETHEKGLGPQH
jgi:hypothetical protein